MAFSCDSCGGMGLSYDENVIVYECSDGGIIGFNETGLSSCGGCRARAEATCEFYGHGEGLSVAPKKPRLTSGISRMRSATGEAGAVSNDTIRKYAQFALVISLVALSVNIYSMRKKK